VGRRRARVGAGRARGAPRPAAPGLAAIGEATVRRVLARVDPEALDQVIGRWLTEQQPPSPTARPPPPTRVAWRQAVALDGKTLRLRHEVARDEWLRWRRFDVMSKT